MTDYAILCLDFVIGTMLGAFFFVGLWWTVQKGLKSEWAAFWFVGSLLLRTSVIMVGFFYVSQRGWLHTVTCLLGFLVARFYVVARFTRKPSDDRSQLKKETHCATQS